MTATAGLQLLSLLCTAADKDQLTAESQQTTVTRARAASHVITGRHSGTVLQSRDVVRMSGRPTSVHCLDRSYVVPLPLCNTARIFIWSCMLSDI